MKTTALPVTADMVVDAVTDALIAVTPDAEIVFWNGAAELMFGYSAAEAIGSSLPDLIVPEAMRDAERQRIASAATERPATFETMRYRRDGTPIYVDVSMQAHTDHLHRTYVVICKKDVTYLKYLREAAVIEAKFRGLLEASPMRWSWSIAMAASC